jgi:hypothetical protein
MALDDATFIGEQLDRHLETGELQYVMPQVRDLCAQHQAAAQELLRRQEQHQQQQQEQEQAQAAAG